MMCGLYQLFLSSAVSHRACSWIAQNRISDIEDCTKSTLCVCLLVRAQGQPALHNPIQETLELERPKEATSRQVHVPCPFCSDEFSSTPDGGAAPAARRRRRATKVGRKVERSGKWWSRLGYRGPACEALPFHTFAPPHLSGVFVWI